MTKKNADFEVGQKVDDYILERHLGGGQDGEVWQARNESFGRIFAIKFLNNVDSQQKSDRFDREIRVLKELHHPCIVNVFAKGTAYNPTEKRNVPYYVMEFLDGVPLDTFLERISPQGAREAFFVLFDHTAKALLEIHRKGMSHGDLKAANIFVLADGLVAKITDFGFGIPPGEKALKREEYPESSYRAPDGLTPQQADRFRLGKTFEDCLRLIESGQHSREFKAIERVLSSLTDQTAEADLNNVIFQMRDLASLREFSPEIDIPELTPQKDTAHFIPDPIHGFILMSAECMAVLDLPCFRRLRGVLAYPSAGYVYPALSPTRFECAIGRYGQLAEMLRQAINVARHVEPSEIKSILLASLLREVGQYPFSSQLSSAASNYDPGVRSAVIVRDTPAVQQIFDMWEVDGKRVLQLIDRSSPNEAIADSLLRGVLSASNVDETIRLLSRIGSHALVPLDRFLRSLVQSSKKRLAIPVRRKDCIADFTNYLAARYKLLEFVTQHHTVVAIDQMLAHSFCELLSGGFSFDELLEVDDSSFLNACAKAANTRELHRAVRLLDSVRRRNIYKRVLSWPGDRALCTPLNTETDMAISRTLELELGRIVETHSLPSGCLVFHSGKNHRLDIDLELIGESGEPISAEDYIPAISNFADMSRTLCATQALFVAPDVARLLTSVDADQLSRTVESALTHAS